jgi:hypothetical protein
VNLPFFQQLVALVVVPELETSMFLSPLGAVLVTEFAGLTLLGPDSQPLALIPTTLN